jgi:hypothetical protein
MPFTLSHAAAALPLRSLLRGAAVFPALVIGCFIPDIPYFLPDPIYDINAHRLPGIFLFGIPCGWSIYVLWYAVFLKPTMALLPLRYALLLVPSTPKPWLANPWATTVSFMAGAFSHVVWDAFTHRRGLVVHVWPALAQPVMHLGHHALPPYFLLQHISTALGMVWLAFYVRRSLREIDGAATATADPPPQLSTGVKVIVIAALMFLTEGLVWIGFSPNSSDPLRLSVYNFVCRSISSAAIVAALYALAWHACYRLRHGRAHTTDRYQASAKSK